MNKNIKKVLVTGAALLMFASIGTGLDGQANASHNIGWRQVTRATNLRTTRGKRLHLRKNQRVYVIKLTKGQKSARIKIGRNYYYVKANLLKLSQKASPRKSVKKNQKNGRWTNQKRTRKSSKKRQRNAKRLVKRASNKRRRNHKRINRKRAKILKSKYRRSNNTRLLKNSGFIDLRAFGPDIMNKYAPNSRKAVIPKNVNIKGIVWLKGHILQKNPSAYAYNAKAHGWVKLAR